MEEALTKKAELDYEMELAKGLQEQVDRLRQENRVLQLDVTVAQKERGLLFAQTTELQGMVDRLTYDKDTLGRDLENAKAQADSAFAEIRRRLTSLDSFLRSGRHPEAVE
jgi:ABC-type phosphate transport system auxiliary subunit